MYVHQVAHTHLYHVKHFTYSVCAHSSNLVVPCFTAWIQMRRIHHQPKNGRMYAKSVFYPRYVVFITLRLLAWGKFINLRCIVDYIVKMLWHVADCTHLLTISILHIHTCNTVYDLLLCHNIMNHNSGFIIGIAHVFCKNPNRTHT